LVKEPYRRVSLKGAVKAQFAVTVAAKAFTQIGDNMINQEGELDKQYTAIEIDYGTKAISEE
jgi:hypothetical protein